MEPLIGDRLWEKRRERPPIGALPSFAKKTKLGKGPYGLAGTEFGSDCLSRTRFYWVFQNSVKLSNRRLQVGQVFVSEKKIAGLSIGGAKCRA